jgi:hypothetical protein
MRIASGLLVSSPPRAAARVDAVAGNSGVM